MTRSKPSKYTEEQSALVRLSGQPARKVRLAASSKRDRNEWAWVVNAAQTAAAVWAERLSARARSRVAALRNMLEQFSELVLLHWNVKSAPPLLISSPQSPLFEWVQPFPTPGAGGALEDTQDNCMMEWRLQRKFE